MATDQTRVDPAVIRQVAQQEGVPFLWLSALTRAESGWLIQAERWAKPGHNATETVKYWIAVQNRPQLAYQVEQLTKDGGADISFGLGQQTYRWSEYWNGWGDLDSLLRCRDAYFDPIHALTKAARQLKPWLTLDPVAAMCRYNKPATGTVTSGVLKNYTDAWDWVKKNLKEVEMADLSDRGFDEKFLGLANDLADKGYDPGWPGNDATYTGNVAIQLTENGMFVWQEGREPVFLEHTDPSKL